MHVRARGAYGTGESLLSAGCRDVKTNSGESIFSRWDRNRGRHGATPTLDGVIEFVDMVRAIRKRRETVLEAMMRIRNLNKTRTLRRTDNRRNCHELRSKFTLMHDVYT